MKLSQKSSTPLFYSETQCSFCNTSKNFFLNFSLHKRKRGLNTYISVTSYTTFLSHTETNYSELIVHQLLEGDIKCFLCAAHDCLAALANKTAIRGGSLAITSHLHLSTMTSYGSALRYS